MRSISEDASLDRLVSELRPDLPDWLALAIRHTQDPHPALFPVEEPAIAKAVPSRRTEFTAGRAAARAALAALQVPSAAIPMAADRAPIWPAGFCGSITHTGPLCLAIAARDTDTAGLGVDLEALAPMPKGTADMVASRTECATLAGAPDVAARRIFSAKEAAYKAQYRQSGVLFDFDTLQFAARTDRDHTLRFTRDVPPFAKGYAIALRQWCGHGLILSLAILPA